MVSAHSTLSAVTDFLLRLLGSVWTWRPTELGEIKALIISRWRNERAICSVT
jgi:hypothetical protein